MVIETEKIKKDEMNHEGFIEETFYKLIPEHDMDLIFIGQIIERTNHHEIKANPTDDGLDVQWVKVNETDFLKKLVTKNGM